MSPDQERWAEELAVERMHGDQAMAFIAGRISALRKPGDAAGVERWGQIADRLARLQSGGAAS